MNKYDVWIYLTNEKGENEETYFDAFEGYLQEIIAATLTLYPQAVGVYARLTSDTP